MVLVSVKYKLFVGIIIATLGLWGFGTSLNYSMVMSSEAKAADYLLSNQLANGAFQIPPYMEKISHMPNPKPIHPWIHASQFPLQTGILLDETAFSLKSMYSLGLSTNTHTFVSAVNFVTQLSTYTTNGNVPTVGETQSQMLPDFLWIQNVFNLKLSTCANLARNIILDNYLKYSYEPLKYVTTLEMPAYDKYQKLQSRYFALKVINILPFVEKENLFDLSPTNFKAKMNDKQIADILTSIYVILRKYLMASYVGNGIWLPKISVPHGGTVGISIEALYYLSELNSKFNMLERKFNVKDEVLKNMTMYGIKKDENMQAVKETIKYIMTSQATDGSWGGITKPLPKPQVLKEGNKEFVRFYREPGLGKVFVTSEAVISLLRMGVPATNTSLERAVEFLINSQSKNGYWSSKFYPWLDVTIITMNALNEYAKYRWNKEINISKELRHQLTIENVRIKMLSQRLGTLYVGILNGLARLGLDKQFNFSKP